MPRKNASTKILSAARDCLIKGVGDFEMSDVAKTADVSEGLAYHYYGSKAGLLSSVIEDFYSRYKEIWNHKYDGDIPWLKREKHRLNAVIEFLYSDPLANIIFKQMGRTSQVANLEASYQEELIELSSRNIKNGIKTGYINETIDPQIAGAAIIGATRQAFTHIMALNKRPSRQVLATQLWNLIAGALDFDKS